MTLDRRARRTRTMLRDALVELILEKGYDAITIAEIAERADLARATFYLHFRDKEDLLATSLEELYDELVERTVSQGPLAMSSPTPSVFAFEHARQNADLYRVLLRGQGVGVIVMRIREHLAGMLEAQLRLVMPKKGSPPVPVTVVANYLSGALLSLISWWLETDAPYSPEQMSLMFHQISRRGSIEALGITPPPNP